MQTKYTGKNSYMTDKEVKFLNIKMLLRICKKKLNIQGEKRANGISRQFSEARQMANESKKSVQPH